MRSSAHKIREGWGAYTRSIIKSPYTYLFLALFCILVWRFAPYAREFFVDTGEDVMYAFFPSAERAFTYGERHFNATDPADYDIARAQLFFYRAAALDPQLPYVYHELARISFLEGNFTVALAQIDLQISDQGDRTPNSYYVRGLIEGYMGDYADAAQDYGHFLKFDPEDWAGMNDYAWVLLKDNQPKAAASVTSAGLILYPNNPWLLNSNATALYEIGDIKDARTRIQQASQAVQGVTTSDWSFAYPGNDPDIAAEGLTTFKAAILNNLNTIDSTTSSGDLME